AREGVEEERAVAGARGLARGVEVEVELLPAAAERKAHALAHAAVDDALRLPEGDEVAHLDGDALRGGGEERARDGLVDAVPVGGDDVGAVDSALPEHEGSSEAAAAPRRDGEVLRDLLRAFRGGGELDRFEEDVEVLARELASEHDRLGDAGAVLVVDQGERRVELVESRVDRLVALDAERPRAELHDVAAADRGGGLGREAPAVEPGAVAAGEVAERPELPSGADRGVSA